MNGETFKPVVVLCVLVTILVMGEYAARDFERKQVPKSVETQNYSGIYAGQWVTTSGKALSGIMQCDLHQIVGENYSGHYTGIWQGVPIDYSADMYLTGEYLRGNAEVDGVHYEYAGTLDSQLLSVRFHSSRYDGHFELKRVR